MATAPPQPRRSDPAPAPIPVREDIAPFLPLFALLAFMALVALLVA